MAPIYSGVVLKVVRYRETTCSIESAFYTTQFVCPCTVGPSGSKQHCPSYPCFLVHVSLNTSYGALSVVTLFVDDLQQAAVNDVDSEQQEMVNYELVTILVVVEDCWLFVFGGATKTSVRSSTIGTK